LSEREVMIAYYEAHPDEEAPMQTATVSLKGKSLKQPATNMLGVKRGFGKRDLALASGVSFGLTFLVITVLYLMGALT
jgi:hypothetical protein